MAIYIMRCSACDNVFETRHPMTFEGQIACPRCGSDSTHKVPTAPGIVFDWHIADETEGVRIGADRYRPPAIPQSVASQI